MSSPTRSLAAIPESSFWLEAFTLAIVAIVVTVAVYGVVALIVKMDDAGVYMTANGRLAATRSLGRGLVLAMPILMTFLSIVGTAAMLWVGGQIVVHGMEVLGAPWLYDHIHHLAEIGGQAVPAGLTGIVTWAITAFFDGVFGLALALLLIPFATHAIMPLYAPIKGV